ncbi:hypothetical protein FE257_004372 [Aspergillus nanangensis]|uniref:Cation-transporting ATPase n=1 Tax=Aspergillus nanangensis TaxID=2582783 RepID=A0AAD4CB16_ASPNN|nr:hypothetical protein FE257_004372 [Aspergillus nanangensis]
MDDAFNESNGGTFSNLSFSRAGNRRDSMRSSYSVVSDVEMARNEVFDGPISESIPSSVVSFSHRRDRNGSNVSFTYFQGEDDFVEWPDEDAIEAGSEFDEEIPDDVSSMNNSVRSSFHSKRPSYSGSTAEEPLLHRRRFSIGSHAQDRKVDSRLNQKVHIESEDLTIVIAGFSTTVTGLIIYFSTCILTFGFAYLIFRWFPRWRVRLVGKPTPLRRCQWVAIEDQWNQFNIYEIGSQEYGRPLSTVFANPESHFYDEDNDPTISLLRYLDYRYLRFFYHPIEDKFCLISGWKDPLWTNAKVMRNGLDADDRDTREQVFGKNLVDIQQKSIFQLLTDEELVPGDVFEVSDPSINQVPSDCILLSGDCIVNESMLTGESVPVSKTPLTDDALKYLNLNAPSVHPNIAKHFLFSGTKVIRARRPQNVDDDEAVALAIVVRTGFLTTKGALIRSMLFPKPSGFKFYRDSFRYISVMAVIAILGFIASFTNFIRLGLSWHFIIVRALDLITIVVPPALPATLTIGTNFALSRLKNHQIFCISPQRVNVGGKLDVICFDKTGTLTEDGLDVLGLRTVDRDLRLSSLCSALSPMPSTSPSAENAYDIDKRNKIIHAMATCHSLRVIDGELLGDPLDVKMFQFTGWSYEEGGSHVTEHQASNFDTIMPSIAKPPKHPGFQHNNLHGDSLDPIELGILRSFEFVSQLRRSSVVIRQFGDNGATIFVKGAPESVRDICRPESLPHDYEDILSQYTHQGYRVIACATKYKRKLSWMKVQKMTREDAESDLEFIGFIIFENKLKPTSAGTITELTHAGIRSVMCTGDNILTAICVARECGLLNKDEQCFIPHFAEGDRHDPKAALCWESVDDPALKLDQYTLMPSMTSLGPDLSIPANACSAHKYSLAITGDVFRWAVDFGSETVLKRMLVRGNVFARMSPDEKHELVEKLQSLDYCCGFCGDGANDCGALKAADVGISLSDAEASVAAPFTSRQFDVSCVPTVIREGRAALVTSFCCFKYMSLYSAIQFSTVSLLYTSASNLGDFQFLFIDLVLILPIAIFIAVYKTVQYQPWFKPPQIDFENPNIENSENTALFLVSSFQYILASVVLSVGPPFRMSIRSNKPFILVISIDLMISAYMLLGPSKWVVQLMQLTYISTNFAWWLLGLAICTFLFSYMAEHTIFPKLARGLGHVQLAFRPNHRKQRRQYKVLLEEMQP